MSKFMSVLEKFNVVEKVNDEESKTIKTESTEKSYNDNNIKDKEQQNQTSTSKQLGNSDHISNDKPNDKPNFERNMPIDEIYSLNNIKNSDVNTIFMLGNFINALPENLPHDVKKSSVLNIIRASNVDIEELLNDGEQRLNVLNEFFQEYENATTNAIEKHRDEIIKLKKLINFYESQIKIRENMLEEQNNLIKYETERINNTISFFKSNREV